ncbi:hypothetical protein [Mangrovihabitans endophyticus]|uniref:Uncharacterized protein n=1 Tax=Mangrovihabitans endophyticus TaxID=1751298 RepID=A0A8J3C0F7_9ACTN|nr:hypothetical protein [Mangrovihabitans endophyticus]GGK90247.1 hypothetical protein GCM10012284_25200 [Mangrovihabitans endophyticus]
MGKRDNGRTRREAFGVAAALGTAAWTVTTVAGCGLLGDDSEPAPAPDPLQPILDEALGLVTAYDRAMATQPDLRDRLAPLRADHHAHATALAGLIGTDLPSSAPAAPAAAASAGTDAVSGLRRAEKQAHQSAVAACTKAPADRVMLVGSVAACRATHTEALHR